MLINGQRATHISIADRGLAYGDGVFETIRYRQSALLFEEQHLQRLSLGCQRLGIELDLALVIAELRQALESSVDRNGIVKVIVTRGEGGRGYRTPSQHSASRIITLHPLPDYTPLQPESGVHAFLCRQQLSAQPALAGIKHLNRLEQVLASSEWPEGDCLEGLMLDYAGHIVEGTRSNLFLASKGMLSTPDLAHCGINGIMRQVLLQHFGSRAVIAELPLADLYAADEVFLCNSVFGVWPLLSLRSAEQTFSWQPGPFAREASELFARALQS